MVTERFLDGLVLPKGEVRMKERGRLPARADEDRFFYRYFWEHAKTENEQHLNGVFLARAEDFRRINGYDERINTYGWDDSDLYARLGSEGAGTDLGLRPVEIRPGAVSHMQHGDALRGANQHLVMGPSLETQVNSQATAALPSWTKVGTLQETEFEYNLHSKDGQLVSAHIIRTPRALLDLVSRQEQISIIDEATNRLLHDIYGFPWSVLSEINRSRGELVRSLASLGRSTHWQSGNGFIFAEVGGTVPERLAGMASAIGLAMKYERPLFLAWSSGTREEPTPRITDFFDVDNSGAVDDAFDAATGVRPSKGARVYQVGRWKCRALVDICAQTDTAFKMMSEFRSGGHDDEMVAAQAVLDVLHGKTPGKRNILLRLEGTFPLQKTEERARALASLTPSRALTDHMTKLGDTSDHLGVYIGSGVRLKGVEAMVRRLNSHNGAASKYFVTGAKKAIVEQARPMLRYAENMVASATGDEPQGSTEEIRDTIRDIAELYGLSHCKSMVNDGRPPVAVSEVMHLLKRRSLKFL
ncbi:unnamed protein product [Chondrus crispus]|uniref:Galactosyltransferase C-terminal domain-containing protein n=1 Tax=Chondrus crispus TaxID=2769 RepID=R7QN77_CHOCR|nr:unnamed protein product [Chondrus crispus]CDF38926.1 unnamed protein product [Chondrus crispus]|eukprot:XP_005718831.1 unnamed protein product [Chondrus crispus]